jgi:predicted RNA methylase
MSSTPSATKRCPACASSGGSTLIDLPQVPVIVNALTQTKQAALAAPRGDIHLVHCDPCGLVYNAAFDPALMHYDGVYENALHFSPQFQAYAETLAKDLVASFSLRGKRLVELGCGDGSFLSRLCELGSNEGFGFDPAFDPKRSAITPGIKANVVRELYTSKTKLPPPDFVSCRHVLEHIPQPADFVRDLRAAMASKPGAGLFFEVPDCTYMLDTLAIWDIIYEHCNYFAAGSISRLFAQAGFEVLAASTVYGGQFLTLKARVPAAGRQAQPIAPDDASTLAKVRRFGDEHRSKVNHWRRVLADLKKSGRKAVLWGAGSKGVTFLNTFSKELSGPDSVLAHAVDLNPRKHGCFIVGAGQQIIAPAQVRDIAPAVVIIMNPIYRDEIGKLLADLGIAAEVLVA